jgi:NADPH-dependent curcumin reductase CurA
VKTNKLQENIVELSVIREKKQRACSPYGPLRAGLITWQDREIVRDDQLQQLSELLSSLENVVDRLNFKSFTAYATLMHAIEGVRVALYDSTQDTAGTDETT